MSILNFAQEVYSTDVNGQPMNLAPRQKFNFTLQMTIHNRNVFNFYKVSTVTQPSFNVDGQLMNQYNRKRFVQTRLNYDPITVSFYDTFDNDWFNIMNDYMAHYYNGGRGLNNTERTNEGTSTVSPFFETDKGYTPNSVRNFFPEIRIIQNGLAGRHTGWILKQPFITTISGDTLDYSDSNPVQWTVVFQPESVENFVSAEQYETLTNSRNSRPAG